MNINLQKYNDLSHSFLYKCMECIYQHRCPNQVSDFLSDGHHWFSLNIPYSVTLRQKVGITSDHGWFKINIYYKAANSEPEIIEQWYLFYLPIKNNESNPNMNLDSKSLKQHTYRCFSQSLRSLYSVIDALPLATMLFVLKELQMIKPPIIYAETSNFMKFPAKIEKFCEEETSKIQFKTVYSPVGKTTVICKYRLDLMDLIPRPIRTTPHINIYNTSRPPSYDQLTDQSQEETVGMSVPHSYEYSRTSFEMSNSTPPMSFVPSNPGPFAFELSNNSLMDDCLSPHEPLPIDEFIQYLDGFSDNKCLENPKIEETKLELQMIHLKLDKIMKEYN